MYTGIWNINPLSHAMPSTNAFFYLSKYVSVSNDASPTPAQLPVEPAGTLTC